MLEHTPIQTAAMSRPRRRPRLPIDAQARRVEELRRAFQRTLNRRPTLIEKAAMLRAAALVARAEAAALDPNMDVGELTKLVNIADRAVRRLGFRAIAAERPARPAAARVLELRRQRWEEAAEAKAARAAQREASSEQNPTESPDGREADK
jgi:hypothetical protein